MSRADTRWQTVEDYIGRFNRHDLSGLLELYGLHAALSLNGDRHTTRAGIGGLFWMLFADFPDLKIEEVRPHRAEATVVCEVVLRATLGRPARGGAAPGRQLQVPACVVFTFDGGSELAEVGLYFDGALLFPQRATLRVAA